MNVLIIDSGVSMNMLKCLSSPSCLLFAGGRDLKGTKNNPKVSYAVRPSSGENGTS